ncbi:TonB-dependent receptor [Carboxylicivirga sp. M1479]|uniref:TonB-dependent receptor n=1 Tax=Carboxylicivirga sp. M1479 TaxID=2594476 RepID=UPI001178BFFE|nr:TonB-dependent receptor [Carboxylicivirga sp. M1479]TRX66122.1 TonB-dependent receptor [Carboxylicivirga sp. M1479]
MKKFYSLVLTAMIAVGAFAQTTINGVVTDDSGEALVGVNVIIKNTYNGTITNADGSYSITSKEETPTLVFSYVGYKTNEAKAENSSLDMKLQTVAVLTDEVIVSAIKAGNKAPIAYTNITKAELQERPAADDIPYMLSLTPSAVATSETGIGVGYTALRIRGTDPTRINVTVNGIPLNDPESQGVFWVNMPDFTSSVDEVQLQRGVGTSTNGAAAFGASINFQTTSINDQASARVESTVGSFNTFVNSVNASTGLLNDKFAFDVRYSKLNSDGYIDYAFSDHQSLYVSGSMLTKNGLLKANIIHGDQRTGISWWGVPQEKLFKPEWEGDDWKPERTYNPAGEYTDEFGETQYYEGQTDNYKQTHYQLFYSHAVNKQLNVNGAVHYTKGEGYYEQYKEDEEFVEYGFDPIMIGDETINETDLIRQKWLDNDFYGFTASANYNGGNVSSSFGIGWNRYEGDHFGEIIWSRYAGTSEKGYQWYDNVGEKSDYNAFAKLNYRPSTSFNTFIDLQLRQIKYTMSGTDDDLAPLVQSHNFSFFNPKLGVSYDIDKKQQAYLSVGVSNREPTRTNFKDAKGDAANYPKAEQLIDFEAGYNYRSSNLSASVNFFYMLYNDQLVPTGEKNNVGADIMTNVEDSYRSGVELVWGARLTKGFNWDGNLSLSANKINNYTEYADLYGADWSYIGQKETYLGTSDIAYSPNVIGSSILSYAFNSNFKLSVISKYVGEQFFDNTSSQDRMMDAYFVNNVKVDINLFPQFAKRIGLQLMVNNVFDVEYENNAYGGNYYQRDADGIDTEYTWAYYYPQAGTHFMTKLVMEF